MADEPTDDLVPDEDPATQDDQVEDLDSARDQMANEWFGDEPDDEDADDTEGEVEDDAADEPDESEPESDDEPEAEAADDPASSDDADDKSSRDRAWDVALQHIQQSQATLDQALKRLERDPSPENAAKAQKEQDRLSQLLSEKADDLDDFDKEVATRLQDLSKRKSEDDAAGDERYQQLQSQNEEIREQLYRISFAQQNPELADRYDELKGKLVDEMRPIADAAEGQVPAKLWAKLTADKWDDIVKRHKAAAKKAVSDDDEPATPKKPEGAKKPKGTKVVSGKSSTSKKPPEDPDDALDRAAQAAFDSFISNA